MKRETMKTQAEIPSRAQDLVDLENQHGAHNYHPLDVVIERAEGVWVYDVEGNRYLDCLAAYSAVNQGHCHPKILATLHEQAAKVTLTSRAFRNDQLPLLCKDLHDLTGYEMVLPMNSGTEAVETALKTARKWGYKVKGIPEGQAEIIVCSGNFHGRTITIVGFSSDEQYRDGFGPFAPGFKIIPYGDIEALRNAITPNTCAFLVEPIQGEAGIQIPPAGFLRQAAELCRENRVLLMADEIQSGLGRTGKLFAYMQPTASRPTSSSSAKLSPAASIPSPRRSRLARRKFSASSSLATTAAPSVAILSDAPSHVRPCASLLKKKWSSAPPN